MMPSSLTVWGKIDLVFGLGQAFLQTLLVALLAPFRGLNTPTTFTRHVLMAACRITLSRLSPEQVQFLAGTTETNYMAWTKAHRLPSRSIEMQSIGTKAFWIGEPDAEKVVLYFHGGGYAMPASDGHFTFASSLVSKAAGSGKSVAVLILQYDLAPGGRYPRQLLQAVELLRHCMDSLGRSPEQLILLGDSAGGNMIFGLLSHLLHSHPGIEPLKLSKPLKTAVLSSPVTSLNTKGQRYRTHEGQDPASAKTIQIWFGNLLEAASPDEWNEPLSNDTDWWLGLERAVEDMMMTVASNEMMADDTRACAANLKSVYENLTLFASEVDFHAEMSIGPSLGLKEGEAAKVIVSYIIERA